MRSENRSFLTKCLGNSGRFPEFSAKKQLGTEPGHPGKPARLARGTYMGSSSGSQPSSSLKQKKHWAKSGSFSVGQWMKPAAAICKGDTAQTLAGTRPGSPAGRVAPGPSSPPGGRSPGGRSRPESREPTEESEPCERGHQGRGRGSGTGRPGLRPGGREARAPGGRAVLPVPVCRRSPPGKASS